MGSNVIVIRDALMVAIGRRPRCGRETRKQMRTASVGYVARASEEGKVLSAEEWAIEDTAERNRGTKLKKNPNTYISDVRLCALNLPRGMDEKVLKAMFLEAGKSDEENGEDGESAGEKRCSRNRNDVRVTHCAIVRDGELKERLKEFGFVTFKKHEHALAAVPPATFADKNVSSSSYIN